MACNSCNKPKEKCGCKPTSISIDNLCNPIDCSTETCSEIYPAQCVIYQGEDILCNEQLIATASDSVMTIIQRLTELACVEPVVPCNLTVSILANVLEEEIELISNVAGGSGNYTYVWSIASAGAVAIALTSTSTANTTVIPFGEGAPFGLIQLIVTDTDTDCQATAYYFVAINTVIEN
jgi:hypothetical protein